MLLSSVFMLLRVMVTLVQIYLVGLFSSLPCLLGQRRSHRVGVGASSEDAGHGARLFLLGVAPEDTVLCALSKASQSLPARSHSAARRPRS